MSLFGGVGHKQIEAPKTKAPLAPVKKVAVTAPLIGPDANAARGLGAYRAGVKAAKTQPLAPMPWTAGGWLGGLKNAFVKSFTQASTDKTADFMKRHTHDFGPGGQAVLKSLEAKGKFDAVDPKWNNLRETVDHYLDNGGNPKAAIALLKQIDDPNTISQVNTNTCAGATAQKALCEQDPAKYFKVMTKLADRGHATLPGGIDLIVSKDARKDIAGEKMSVGERLNSLFQAAATEYANGTATYDFSKDTSNINRKGTKHDQSFKGVDLNRARDLNEALMDARTIIPGKLQDAIDAHKAAKDGIDREHAISRFVQSTLSQDLPEGKVGVFLAVKSQHHHKAHMVMVKGVDDAGNFKITDANGHDKVWTPQHLAKVVCLSGEDKVGDNTGMAATDTNTATTTSGPRRR